MYIVKNQIFLNFLLKKEGLAQELLIIYMKGNTIMKHLKDGSNFLCFFAFITILVFALVKICYAQGQEGLYPTAPEPVSLALISTGGIFGYIIRFARKRFQEFKRCFDVIVSVLGLTLASPIIAVTAILIKRVSPGPVFFRQERVGLNGEIFNIYKLRTMKIDAEKDTGPMWAQEDDPRLIKCGKIIRKMHIDELPQLFNVLRGEMSIVGPRPERPVFVKKLKKEIPDYAKRLLVKPGITGLAQVWHKYDETLQDVKRKIKYDLLYIKKMCLMVDLRILLRTILVVARGQGAR